MSSGQNLTAGSSQKSTSTQILPASYDLVINAGRVSINAAVDAVMSALGGKENGEQKNHLDR